MPKCRGFKMASLNITSLLKHIDELRVFLNDQNIDVLAINETRLNESILDQEVKVQGYDIIRRDRSTNGRFGGGVCFYIRSNISYTVRTDLDSHSWKYYQLKFVNTTQNPLLFLHGTDPLIHPMNFLCMSTHY